MINKAVILCAGRGSRLSPLTDAVPKALLPLGPKPVISYVLNELEQAGISEICIVISEETKLIAAQFEHNFMHERYTYCFQTGAYGSATALLTAEEWINGEPFVVAYGDAVMIGEDPTCKVPHLVSMMDFHNYKPTAAVLLSQVIAEKDVERCGIVDPGITFANYTKDLRMNGYCQVDNVAEKPSISDTSSRLGIAGRFIFDPIVFDYIHRTPRGKNREYQLTDTLKLMCNQTTVANLTMVGTAKCQDIGTMEDYLRINKMFIGDK
jgi:UTP--glucose-1-phosphate uridylyltransferase